MATPHVSGVAALVWSANLSKTNVEIRDALTETVLDLGTAGKDMAYGYGLVQAYDAWELLGGGSSKTPPSVSITSPADDASFDSGTSISFAGSASDAEDGNLTNDLVWTSNLDGQIGTGGSFNAVLSDGTHHHRFCNRFWWQHYQPIVGIVTLRVAPVVVDLVLERVHIQLNAQAWPVGQLNETVLRHERLLQIALAKRRVLLRNEVGDRSIQLDARRQRNRPEGISKRSRIQWLAPGLCPVNDGVYTCGALLRGQSQHRIKGHARPP